MVTSQHARPHRGLALSTFLGLAVAVFAAAPAASPPARAADPAFTPDGAAAELVRALNGERAAHGLAPLAVDPFLADKMRDGAVACPNGAGNMAGRAKDMATYAYFSHQLRRCPTYGALDAMRVWGYDGAMGEIIATNSGYDYSSVSYQYGCDINGANCAGPTSTAPHTVAIAATGFMMSQGHRDIVLSTAYDRFACGAWQVPWPAYPTLPSTYYACDFSFGPAGTPQTIPPPDTTPPTVARSATRSGNLWSFRATFRDARGLSSGSLALDGRVIARWSFGGATSAGRVVRARTYLMRRGYHTLTWQARDRAGNLRVTRLRIWNRGY